MARLDYSALNSTVRYTMWSVFRVEPGRLGDDRNAAATQAAEFVEALEGKGVVVRGVYDLVGMRADADYLIWWHAEDIESLQAAYADWRRTTAIGRASVPVWSQAALHRIVDLMRDLRATEARRHVREEIPFFTGPRVQVGDLAATLP